MPAHDSYEDRVSTVAGDVITAWKSVDLGGTSIKPAVGAPADASPLDAFAAFAGRTPVA